MRKERIKAKVSDLVLNEGQLGWLPTNPRQWTQSDVDKTKASLKNDEDFMEDRPIMVLQCDGKLLVFAGNLRTTAAKALKWQVIDAVLYIPENDEDKETIKRRSILDNGSFGSWDYDMLANEWDDLPLPEWGVPAWSTEDVSDLISKVNEEDYGEDFEVPNVEKSPFRTISFNVTDEENELIYLAIDISNHTEGNLQETEDENTNTKGLMFIVRGWLKKEAGDLDIEEERSAEDIEEELRSYLRTALKKSGKTQADVDQHLGTAGMSGHYFGSSQWMFPTYSAYKKMREIMDLPRDYMECYRLWAKSKKIKLLGNYGKS